MFASLKDDVSSGLKWKYRLSFGHQTWQWTIPHLQSGICPGYDWSAWDIGGNRNGETSVGSQPCSEIPHDGGIPLVLTTKMCLSGEECVGSTCVGSTLDSLEWIGFLLCHELNSFSFFSVLFLNSAFLVGKGVSKDVKGCPCLGNSDPFWQDPVKPFRKPWGGRRLAGFKRFAE